jgi:head-tail adaptor
VKYGRLRHVASIQSAADTTDSEGSTTTAYTTVGTVRADLQVATGREFVEERETAGETVYKVHMRYEASVNGGLTRKHRILIDGDSIETGAADIALDVIEPGFIDHQRRMVTAICVRRDR